jgi:aspartate-semialdehyde dehydrogenase
MSYKVAVVGATGNVGREILKTLAERQFPISNVVGLGSAESVGTSVSFGDNDVLKISALSDYNFKGTDFVFSSINAIVTRNFVPKAVAEGAIVIDNSSAFRMSDDVPLIVPEVNGHLLDGVLEKKNGAIIASPNCIATPLSLVLKNLESIAPIKRVVISTYQSTSGAGREGMDELHQQVRALFMNDPIQKNYFQKQIAYNVIPQIDSFDIKTGITGEESKVMEETSKVLGTDIKIAATCVRVPTFIGHAISAAIEFESDVDPKEARNLLLNAEGILVVDRPSEERYATPLDSVAEDGVIVSRIRKDPSVSHGLLAWIVSDNLRKGAALNVVQIAERIIQTEHPIKQN